MRISHTQAVTSRKFNMNGKTNNNDDIERKQNKKKNDFFSIEENELCIDRVITDTNTQTLEKWTNWLEVYWKITFYRILSLNCCCLFVHCWIMNALNSWEGKNVLGFFLFEFFFCLLVRSFLLRSLIHDHW